jgi:hypothetical protein
MKIDNLLAKVLKQKYMEYGDFKLVFREFGGELVIDVYGKNNNDISFYFRSNGKSIHLLSLSKEKLKIENYGDESMSISIIDNL